MTNDSKGLVQFPDSCQFDCGAGGAHGVTRPTLTGRAASPLAAVLRVVTGKVREMLNDPVVTRTDEPVIRLPHFFLLRPPERATIGPHFRPSPGKVFRDNTA